MADSLQSPQDRREGQAATTAAAVQSRSQPPLSTPSLVEAAQTLNKDLTYVKVDRRYCDPPILNQKIVLVSFTPSKKATPDVDNIYGMMKVRGVFATEQEANEYSEKLIREVDSLHEIYHAWVGRPFPVTTVTGYEKELKSIDIRKKTVDMISEDILSRRRADEKELHEIQDKEKRLLEESKKAQNDEPLDPFEGYITEQVKRAQLIWTYKETVKKISQMRDIVNKTNHEIRGIEAEHPEFVDKYKDKYMAARREAGIPDDDDSFIRYLGVDNLDHVFDDQAPSV
jgi:hypothetical protein